jgi:AcrR family transcriptional regulator
MTTRTRKRARRGEGGALHSEILVAARQLLADTGSDEAVSVRAVADRVGVSTPSIYLHFADKDALIDAVCESVFADLGQAMEDAAEGVTEPFEALKQRGLAYVRFALANPEHYRIVLMSRGNAANSAAHMLTTSTYQNLVDSVRQCQQAGVFARDSDPTELGTSLWAAAHGIAALLISNPTLVDPEHQMLVVEQVISAAGLGLALLQRIPQEAGDPCPADLVAGLDAALGPPQAYAGPIGPKT